MNIMNFKVLGVHYQRNGTTGRRFHVVRFTFDMERNESPEMIGIFPVGGEHRGPDVECYVFCPSLPDEGWRGDAFADAVRGAILVYEQEQQAMRDRLLGRSR